MNKITNNHNGSVSCSCGANAGQRDRKRFLKRHPQDCSPRLYEFAAKLSQTVNNTDDIPRRFDPEAERERQIIEGKRRMKEEKHNL